MTVKTGPTEAIRQLRTFADRLERRAEQFEMAVEDVEAMDDPDVADCQLIEWAAKAEAYELLAGELRRHSERLEGS